MTADHVSAVPEPAGIEEVAYRGRVFEIVHQPMRVGDVHRVFEFARRAPGVRIILRDISRSAILITREYRHELGRIDLRLPGGKVFDSLEEYSSAREEGRSDEALAIDAARREAAEEVGYELRNPLHLRVSHCGATVVWDLHFVLCTVFAESGDGPTLEPGEQISHEWWPEERVIDGCLSGAISEERSAATLLRLLIPPAHPAP